MSYAHKHGSRASEVCTRSTLPCSRRTARCPSSPRTARRRVLPTRSRWVSEGRASDAPVRPRGHCSAAVCVDLHAQYLVQLNRPSLEAETRPGHVKRPDTRASAADLSNRFVPVRGEVCTPARQRPRIVLAQVLLVPDLEPVVLHRGHNEADTFELSVGEDITVDEPAEVVRLRCRRPGDAV